MKKFSLIISALALVLGLSQCQKRPNMPTFNGGYQTQTITFSNSDNGGQKGAFQEDVAGVLDYHWDVNNDVIHVYATKNAYQADGTTDFNTQSEYCGILDEVEITNPGIGTEAQFTGEVSIPNGTQALRFVHYGKNVNVENGKVNVNFAVQTGLLKDVSDNVVAYCDRKYESDTYKDCYLRVPFAIVKFSFAKFSSNEMVKLETIGKTHINVSAGGAITHETDGGMTFNITATGESTTDKNEYFTVMMPRENTTYKFTDDVKEAVKPAKIDANIFYTKKDSAGEPIELDAQETGALSGKFSVASDRQIQFSKGNLQYRASTNTWRFAANQYDLIGSSNASISQTYDGWIDLFGWGTSGIGDYSPIATCYQPWSVKGNTEYYKAYGDISKNLYDDAAGYEPGRADWGYNAIQNGGNMVKSGWRTLTREEWQYLINKNLFNEDRKDENGKKLYGNGKIGTVTGLILLPDEWKWSEIPEALRTFIPGDGDWVNIYNLSQWAVMESAGAVFLPAAGLRYELAVSGDANYVGYVGSYGFYWSSSYGASAYRLSVTNEGVDPNSFDSRFRGLSVRLVR